MNKRNLFLGAVGLVVVTAMISTSCSNNSKEVLFANNPQPICDTVNIKYSSSIKQIIDANCLSCHSASNSGALGGGTILDDYNNLFNNLDTTTGSGGGSLFININSGRMPKNQAKLNSCEIAKIGKWISEGAKNN